MNAFNWSRMDRTPEGSLRRGEDKLTIQELAEKSRGMAESIIRPGRLVDEIRRHMDELLNSSDNEKLHITEEVVRRNPGVIPDHVELPKDQAALVLEIAILIRESDTKTRQGSN